MTIAYVCHHGRPNYELSWFAAAPFEKVKFLTTQASPPPSEDPKIEYCTVKYREAGWENHFFGSTARRVFYSDFEQYLHDVDVVVVLEVFSSLSRQFVEYCQSIGKPVVVLVYELIETHPIYKLPRYRANTRAVIKGASSFIAASHAAARHLQHLGAAKSRIKVIYPGVDTALFQPDLSHRDEQAIVYVGPRLGLHKGIDLILDLYPRLHDARPHQKLTIVGEGGEEAQVRALATKYPGVTFSKPIPNREVPAVLNQHGIFIFPARDTKRLGQRIGAEQFGFSVVEAMACGLAVITSDCGALPEIATDANIIVPQGDAKALSDKTSALLGDVARIRQMGEENRQIALTSFDLVTQARALCTALAQATSSTSVAERA